MAEKNAEIQVEICFAKEDEQLRVFLTLPQGSTVQTALDKSGLFEKLGLNVQTNKVGVFSKLAKPDTPLRDRDRVEIYRPLIADPKLVRKQRAESGKTMKKNNN